MTGAAGRPMGAAGLLFLGDIGVARAVPPPPATHPAFGKADLVVANLEGAIHEPEALARLRSRQHVALHNDPAVLDVLHAFGVRAVALANNHVYDFRSPIRGTRERLQRAGIASFGAGAGLDEASSPAVLPVDGGSVRLLAFGWTPIGCRPAGRNREGVNPLEPRHALGTVRRERASHPEAALICMLHWNYELEPYPQPAHRQLAHELIHAGADVVVGGHPHVAGGIELVAGKPVAYSLGNWIFPPRDVRGFEVSYPETSRRQLALSVRVRGRDVSDVRLLWHRFQPETGELSFDIEEAIDGPVATALSPFREMEHDEYVRWFRANRTRRRALPLYADCHARSNLARDGYLRLRRGGGEVLARLGLKREQRGAAAAAAVEAT